MMNRTEEKDNLTSTHDLFKKERNHEQEIPAKCINFVLELLYLLLGLVLHLFGTLASALFVVNGAGKVPLVATGTGNFF